MSSGKRSPIGVPIHQGHDKECHCECFPEKFFPEWEKNLTTSPTLDWSEKSRLNDNNLQQVSCESALSMSDQDINIGSSTTGIIDQQRDKHHHQQSNQEMGENFVTCSSQKHVWLEVNDTVENDTENLEWDYNDIYSTSWINRGFYSTGNFYTKEVDKIFYEIHYGKADSSGGRFDLSLRAD